MSHAGVLIHTPWELIAQRMRSQAIGGYYDGWAESPQMRKYLRRCTRTDERGVRLLFTRDIGMHSSGWWKNPDYERCWHLSLSFWNPLRLRSEPAPHDHREAAKIVRAFFGDDRNLVWGEPPFSEFGRGADVWHYRLFCDEGWQPLKPRGEVYTREFTEAGWKSWSDVNAPDGREAQP